MASLSSALLSTGQSPGLLLPLSAAETGQPAGSQLRDVDPGPLGGAGSCPFGVERRGLVQGAAGRSTTPSQEELVEFERRPPLPRGTFTAFGRRHSCSNSAGCTLRSIQSPAEAGLHTPAAHPPTAVALLCVQVGCPASPTEKRPSGAANVRLSSKVVSPRRRVFQRSQARAVAARGSRVVAVSSRAFGFGSEHKANRRKRIKSFPPFVRYRDVLSLGNRDNISASAPIGRYLHGWRWASRGVWPRSGPQFGLETAGRIKRVTEHSTLTDGGRPRELGNDPNRNPTAPSST
eukprot:scaffold845_cov231-Pinguiococcus_pyrenoidosus.AAC.2